MHGHGHGMHGHGMHGQNPDVYGTPPHPQEPLQHGGVGRRPAKELSAKEQKEQQIRDVVEKAKKLAKDPSLIPGPKMEDGALPAPPEGMSPIFAEPRPTLDFSSPSVDLPVYGKPVEIAQMPTLLQVWSIAVARSAERQQSRRGHRSVSVTDLLTLGTPKPREPCDQSAMIIVSYYLALLCGAWYEIWLMRTVLHGYRRIFADLVKGRRYHGQELVKTAGPGIFHAQWGTYCCGALIGNAAMALVLLMFILWLLFLVLSLPQFWQMLWGFRSFWIVYGLTYATRWSIFRFVIPQKVVTDDGSVLRRRANIKGENS
eukprot:symbB.v1.2.009132.t1/scaffold577.1/size258142/7